MPRPTAKARISTPRPRTLWLVGALLIWLILIVPVVDILLAPQWFAPHWRCDSLGIPILTAHAVTLPWAAVSAAIAGLLTLLACRGRAGGTGILDLPQTFGLRSVAALAIALALATPFAYDLVTFGHDVLAGRTWTADCNGRADPIQVSMRRPAIQVMPLLDIALILWIAQLRAWAVSPWADTPATPVATGPADR